MRRYAGLAVIAAAIVVLVGSGFAEAAAPGDPFLPDLRTLPPHDLRIQNAGGSKLLYFSNTVGNYGEGPLELHAVNDATTRKTKAYQDIWTMDEQGNTHVLSTTLVGTFEFHPTHSHWHFGDYAHYEIRTVGRDNLPGRLLRHAEKVSFCIIDTDTVAPSLPNFDWGNSHGCGQTSRQGLRVGRGDTYSSFLPDQYVDVTGLADGQYFLVSTVDPPTALRPNGRMIESDDTNNSRAIKIEIIGNVVHVIG